MIGSTFVSRRRSGYAIAVAALCFLGSVLPPVSTASAESARERELERERAREQSVTQVTSITPGVVPGLEMSLKARATVNMMQLSKAEAFGQMVRPTVRVRQLEEAEEGGANEMGFEPGAKILGPPALALPPPPSLLPLVASPSPSVSYQGLDDIPMVDSSYIIIPPDVGGAVGPSKVMETFNNNYRIRDKATGVTQLTVGTATFWNPVVTNKALLNGLTDPRTTYDPVNGRWITVMQTTNNPGQILFAVSQTSDPAGSWFLSRSIVWAAAWMCTYQLGIGLPFPSEP